MDSLITAAARAVAVGDPLGALKRVALRDDAPALALRGLAMAQLGDFARARDLLRQASRAFGPQEPLARARCTVADAEIALVSRDLTGTMAALDTAQSAFAAHGDRTNAAHAAYLAARHLLLIGRLDEAERKLDALDATVLPPPSRIGHDLVVAGIAMRRLRTAPARAALQRATRMAEQAKVPALVAEVAEAQRTLEAPSARMLRNSETRMLRLDEVEALLASGALVVDACRTVLRSGNTVVALAGRPVLFALARTLAEAWPGDAARDVLLRRAFRAREADDSHRARLRVEMGRLRQAIKPLADVTASKDGFILVPRAPDIAVLTPPVEGEHGDVLALLADGEAWSTSALALALGVSARTVQRALEVLQQDGRVHAFGRGPARRWTAPSVPGFPTSLLLPAPLPRS